MFLNALPDYLVYIVLPVLLAFWTYRDITVFHSKTVFNKIQFWAYTLTFLTASLLFKIGKIGYFPIIITVVFLLMALIENREIGKVIERLRLKEDVNKPEGKEEIDGNKSAKKKGNQILRKMNINFIFSFIVAVLSFLNFFGVFNFLY